MHESYLCYNDAKIVWNYKNQKFQKYVKKPYTKSRADWLISYKIYLLVSHKKLINHKIQHSKNILKFILL